MVEDTHNKIIWSVHPLKEEEKFKTFFLLVTIGITTFFSTLYFNLYYGTFAFVVLFLSLIKYFFKTVYVVDNEKIASSLWFGDKTWKWNQFKRYHLNQNHLQLSPLENPSRLDQYRSLLLPLPDQKIRLQVMELVKAKLGEKND